MINSSQLLSASEQFDETWSQTLTLREKKMFLLGILVVATTRNDSLLLDKWLLQCDGILMLEEIEEVLLQTLLFAGFPRTIESLKHLRKVYPKSSLPKHVDDYQAAGEATSRIVYGKHHSRLKEVMDDLHPDLTRWMIEDGYGRVLSRPGLNLQERELSVVASLMASGMINQYRAHLRGAMLCGVKRVDIIWFTNTFKCIIAADLRSEFQQVTEQMLEV